MNRRSLLRHGGRAAALAPFWAAAPALAGLSRLNAAAQTVPPGVLRRIGITTVCFRDRFVAAYRRYCWHHKGAFECGIDVEPNCC